MALLKFLQGNQSSLPTKSTEGWIYVTKDTGNMYIFTAEDAYTQLNADKATYLRSANDNTTLLNAGGTLQPVYVENGVATAITSTLGSSAQPIYLNNGKFTLGSSYAGGTRITLNGSDKGGSTASFYAPTSAGTSGYILKSNGSGAPTWSQMYWADIALATAASTSTTPTFGAGFKFNVSSNSVLSSGNNLVLSTPIAKYAWHDLLSFGVNNYPSVEVSADSGTTWTTSDENDLKKELFIQRENQAVVVLNDTNTAIRWTWNNSQFHACNAKYLNIGFAYQSSQATFDILFETSQDGNAWTTGFTKTGVSYNSAPYWFYLSTNWSNQKYIRLTLTRTSASGTKSALSTIRLLTSRWGNQGRGSEDEVPFVWDYAQNIYPRLTNASTLGTSSYKWANVYATTFTGDLAGNASTATKWKTARTISISSTAGTTGTSIDGSADKSLVIPATLTGFTSITSTNFVGNASTATKWKTARTLSLTGDVTGSVSMDGSADASITTTVTRTIGYGTCATAAATAAKVVTIDDDSWVLEVGSIVGVKFSYTNTASSCTINVNGTGAKSIYYNNAVYTSTSGSVCGYANRVIYYMYNGTYWVWLNGSLDANDNTVPSAICTTAAATAAKTASCTYYTATAKTYVHVLIRYANTSATALTLNINGQGAKPIYINGTASSTSNYTLPAGTYIVYYDGTNYYFRTDGKISGIDHSHSVSFTPVGTIVNTSITPAGTISSTSITPAGTVAVSIATPTGSQTANYTPEGSVTSKFTGTAASHAHTFTGTAASHNHTFTGTAASHTHTFAGTEATLSTTYTPTGTVSQPTFTGTSVTVPKTSTTGTTVASSGHTHSVTAAGTVSKPTFTGSQATISTKYTPAGSVASAFTGTEFETKTTDSSDSSNYTAVASSTHGHGYTPAGAVTSSFSGTKATISASYTPAGTVTSTFTGSSATTSSATPGISESVSNRCLTITLASHTHTVTATGSVSSTFTGTQATISTSYTPAGSITSTFTGTAGSTTSITGTTSVPSMDHTHKATATGTVSSTFTGTQATISTDYTPTGTVSQPTFTGTAITSGSPSATSTVAAQAHTHSVTAKGTVSQPTFTGEEATLSVSYTPEGSISSKSLTPAGSISSTSLTPAGSISSTSITPAGSVASSFAGTSKLFSATFTGTAASHNHAFTGTAASHNHTFTGTSSTVTSSAEKA